MDAVSYCDCGLPKAMPCPFTTGTNVAEPAPRIFSVPAGPMVGVTTVRFVTAGISALENCSWNRDDAGDRCKVSETDEEFRLAVTKTSAGDCTNPIVAVKLAVVDPAGTV